MRKVRNLRIVMRHDVTFPQGRLIRRNRNAYTRRRPLAVSRSKRRQAATSRSTGLRPVRVGRVGDPAYEFVVSREEFGGSAMRVPIGRFVHRADSECVE